MRRTQSAFLVGSLGLSQEQEKKAKKAFPRIRQLHHPTSHDRSGLGWRSVFAWSLAPRSGGGPSAPTFVPSIMDTPKVPAVVQPAPRMRAFCWSNSSLVIAPRESKASNRSNWLMGSWACVDGNGLGLA